MSEQILNKKIDFLAVVSVEDANPNGDPLNGNRPRQHYDNVGFITPVCIKRKLRNRLQDMGRKILIQQNDRTDDGITNISERINAVDGLKEARKKKDNAFIAKKVCETFEDVRAFGATLALKDKTSVGIRGAVTIQQAKSIGMVDIDSNQITKSTNSEPGEAKGSDTMGMMHTVRYGVYVIKGSINPHFAARNGFTEQDAEDIKYALSTLFENDESSARPAGSMNVMKTYWWEQIPEENKPFYSTKRVLDTIRITTNNPDNIVESWDDIQISEQPLPDLKPEIIGEN